jgi:hypothetical protein
VLSVLWIMVHWFSNDEDECIVCREGGDVRGMMSSCFPGSKEINKYNTLTKLES